jgi:hypothetical protein
MHQNIEGNNYGDRMFGEGDLNDMDSAFEH